MTIIYEVTWSHDDDHPYPTDEFPRFVEVLDLAAPSCVSYRRLARGKVR